MWGGINVCSHPTCAKPCICATRAVSSVVLGRAYPCPSHPALEPPRRNIPGQRVPVVSGVSRRHPSQRLGRGHRYRPPPLAHPTNVGRHPPPTPTGPQPPHHATRPRSLKTALHLDNSTVLWRRPEVHASAASALAWASNPVTTALQWSAPHRDHAPGHRRRGTDLRVAALSRFQELITVAIPIAWASSRSVNTAAAWA